MEQREVVWLLYVVIGAIVVFNWLRRWITQWRSSQQDPSVSIAGQQEQARAPVHPPSGNAGRRLRRKAQISPASLRRIPARRYLANRSLLRQAIITAVILGPCRAQQPTDE